MVQDVAEARQKWRDSIDCEHTSGSMAFDGVELCPDCGAFMGYE